MQEFNKRLQYVIDTKKIKQSFIVKNTRFTSAQVSRWLSGEVKSPIRTTIAELAEALECNFKWLADNKGEPFQGQEFKTGETKSKYVPDTGEMEKELFYKKASIHFEEIFDWIYDEIGTDAKSIRQGFKIIEESCPDFRQWRYNTEAEVKTKQTGTDN